MEKINSTNIEGPPNKIPKLEPSDADGELKHFRRKPMSPDYFGLGCIFVYINLVTSIVTAIFFSLYVVVKSQGNLIYI